MVLNLLDECLLLLHQIILGEGKRALPINFKHSLTLLNERHFNYVEVSCRAIRLLSAF